MLPVLVVAYLLVPLAVVLPDAAAVELAAAVLDCCWPNLAAFIGDLLAGVVTPVLPCLVLMGEAFEAVVLPAVAVVPVLAAVAPVAVAEPLKNLDAPVWVPLKLLFLALVIPLCLEDIPPVLAVAAVEFLLVVAVVADALVVAVVAVAPTPVVLLTPVAVWRDSLSLASCSFFWVMVCLLSAAALAVVEVGYLRPPVVVPPPIVLLIPPIRLVEVRWPVVVAAASVPLRGDLSFYSSVLILKFLAGVGFANASAYLYLVYYRIFSGDALTSVAF